MTAATAPGMPRKFTRPYAWISGDVAGWVRREYQTSLAVKRGEAAWDPAARSGLGAYVRTLNEAD